MSKKLSAAATGAQTLVIQGVAVHGAAVVVTVANPTAAAAAFATRVMEPPMRSAVVSTNAGVLTTIQQRRLLEHRWPNARRSVTNCELGCNMYCKYQKRVHAWA